MADLAERIEELYERADDQAFCLKAWANQCRRDGQVQDAEAIDGRAAIARRRASRLWETLQDELASVDPDVMAESFAEWRADARTR